MTQLQDIIKGQKISLRPATEQDKRAIYEWMAHSDITSSHMGPPVFPDNPIPTWEEFCLDYKPYFFDGTQPESGRCFIIMADGELIGQINHDKIYDDRKRTELDIWMSSEANCGKGYGSDALQTLCKYLFEKYGVVELVVRPSARNLRAINAYEKAGFQHVEMTPKQQEVEFGHGDYNDDVVLIKRIAK